jgi:hypothetical protein
MALKQLNFPITDFAFTSDNLYSFINHNSDFHRRLTIISTQLQHNDKFNTKIHNDHGKSPYRHSPDVRNYIKLLHRVQTAPLQRKAKTIPSSLKSAPTFATVVKQNMDNSFKTTLNSNPGSTKMDNSPVSEQNSASKQPSSFNQRLVKSNNCTNYKKRSKTNSKSNFSSKQNVSSTSTISKKPSPSGTVPTSNVPSRPPSLTPTVLPSDQPLLQKVNVMGLTRFIHW